MSVGLLALLLASPPAPLAPPTRPAPASLLEAANALDAGRVGQARDMIARAIAAGEHGLAVDRLLSRLALSERRNDEALAGFRSVLERVPGDEAALIGAATAAARLGKDADALALASAAARAAGASWAAFNLLGVLADRRGDWGAADQAYAEAMRRAPGKPAVLNNAGWSAFTRGDWTRAEALFVRAAARDPGNPVIADNLELARAALADRLPTRRPGEPGDEFAARLNDAGVAARMAGDERRAAAAFSRAIEARGRWFERAYNNLLTGRSASR